MRRERCRADLEDALEAGAMAMARPTAELIDRDAVAEETLEEVDRAEALLAGALLDDDAGEEGPPARERREVEWTEARSGRTNGAAVAAARAQEAPSRGWHGMCACRWGRRTQS